MFKRISSLLQDIEKCLQALEELSAVPVTSQILQKNSDVITTLKKVRLPCSRLELAASRGLHWAPVTDCDGEHSKQGKDLHGKCGKHQMKLQTFWYTQNKVILSLSWRVRWKMISQKDSVIYQDIKPEPTIAPRYLHNCWIGSFAGCWCSTPVYTPPFLIFTVQLTKHATIHVHLTIQQYFGHSLWNSTLMNALLQWHGANQCLLSVLETTYSCWFFYLSWNEALALV